MKTLILVSMLAFTFTAKAEVKSNCAAAAEKVALQMYLGTSTANSRDIFSDVEVSFDENAQLVFNAEIVENITGFTSISDSFKYKIVAKGNEQNCEILSVNQISKQ